MPIAMGASCSDIEKTAISIKKLNENYTQAYQSVFAAFKNIDSAWDGEDNDEFNKLVLSFEKDFVAMTALLSRVETHLNLTSKAYKTVESATVKAAGKLSK
ncbi:MAG: hypothetical protein NC397_03555 [Clostridium sp.]|nr:hypothetical protein [Clostridium sp.]